MSPLAVALSSFAAAIGAAAASTPVPVPPADAVDGLTVRQLAGQRVVVGYPGPGVPPALLARARRGEIGGVIVFDRNIPSRARLRREMVALQATRRPLDAPLLTMVDQEGGLVARLDGAPAGAPADMAARGPGYVGEQGRATARNLRQVGMNVNLAPVADLGLPGSYQHSTRRAFARRAAAVSRLATAFAAGLQRGGVAATLKHFPGLGRVPGDEDDRVQTVGATAHTLRSQDEVPFATAVDAGTRLVMTSTARYPAFDRRPALLSSTLTTDELRGRLGFRGVAITDDLDVDALRPYGAAGRLGVDATRAGNDLLLYAQSAAHGARAVEAIVAAERAGRIDRDDLEASVRRVAALRRTLGG